MAMITPDDEYLALLMVENALDRISLASLIEELREHERSFGMEVKP